MARAKYAVLNGDACIGLVYENEKLGRTLVLNGTVNNDFELQIVNMDASHIADIDLKQLILSLIPRGENNNGKKS